MKKAIGVLLLGILALGLGAQRAQADSQGLEFTFTVNPIPTFGSIFSEGLVTVTPESGDTFLVTGFSPGSFATTPAEFGMFLLPAGTYGNNDNLVFQPNGPFLDSHGLGFEAGGTDWDIYFDSSLSEYLLCEQAVNPSCQPGDGFSVNFFSLEPFVPVPEPSPVDSLSFGLIGLIALIGVMRHRGVNYSGLGR